MSLLDIIPAPYRIAAEIAIVVALAGGAAWFVHHERELGRTEGRAEVQAKWDHEKAAQQAVAIKAQADNAAETERRLAAQQEASRAHEKALTAARTESAAAAADVARLRQRIAAISAGGGPAGNPAAAAVSTPASRVGAVAAEAVSEYSALADVARLGQLAGRECEAAYDALSEKFSQPKGSP